MFRFLKSLVGAALLMLPMAAAWGESTELRFSNAKIEVAYPGDWTEIALHIVNGSDRERNCEVEIQCGDLDTGVHACAFPFSLPAKAERRRVFPVLLPPLFEREPKAVTPESVGAPGAKSPRPREKRKTIAFSVLLKEGGAEIQRETYFAPVMVDMPTYLGQEVWNPGQEPEKVLPAADLEGYFVNLKNLEMRGKMSPVRLVRRMRALGDTVAPWRRNSQEALFLAPIPITAYEEREILEWVSAGGLLFIEPLFEDAPGAVPRSWHRELGFAVAGPALGDAPPGRAAWAANFKPPKTRVARGLQHLYGPAWREVTSDDGVPIGAVRDWGEGRIVALNTMLEDVVQGNTAVEEALLREYLPRASAAIQAGESRWQEDTLAWQARVHGFRVWPILGVSLYLGLFALLAGALVFLPGRFLGGEARWIGWVVISLAFSGTAATLQSLTADQATRVMASRVVLSRAGKGGDAGRELGALSVASGQKRSLNLALPWRWQWRHQTSVPLSKELRIQDDSWLWRDYRLLPGRPCQLSYRAIAPVSPALSVAGPVVLKVGRKLDVALPASWTEGEMALVFLRRIWFFSATGTASLDPGAGRCLGAIEGDETWRGQVLALARARAMTLDGNGRCWLVRHTPGAESGLQIAGAIMEGGLLEVIELPWESAKGDLLLEPGMADLRFIKGQANEQEIVESRYFDGALFRDIDEGAKLTMVFSAPRGLEFTPVRASLDFHIVPPPDETVKLEVDAGGSWRKLEPSSLQGVIELPPAALKNGKVRVRVSHERRGGGEIVLKKWRIPRLEVSMSGASS